LIGQVVVASILFAVLGIDELPTGGATAETLLISSAVAIAFAATILWWFRLRHPRWREVVGVPPASEARREAVWGGVAGLVLYPAVALVAGSLILLLLRAVSGESVETPDQLSPGLEGTGRLLAAAYAIAIAPVVEELYFRGVLFRGIADRHGAWSGAIVSSVLFGLVHWPVGEPLVDALVLPIVMTVTGLGLAWIYVRRGNLVAPVAAHVVFNAIGIAIIFSGTAG
jgi:membrane protease YdiL (CAAX protease family)